VDISYLHREYEYGLRAIGLSHFDVRKSALILKWKEVITLLGKRIIKEMSRLNLIHCDCSRELLLSKFKS
jgi:membrane dipeptidase